MLQPFLPPPHRRAILRNALPINTGNLPGVRRRAEGTGLGLNREGTFDSSCRNGVRNLAKFAVQICRPDLHEHMRVVERPAHLLLLNYAVADE